MKTLWRLWWVVTYPARWLFAVQRGQQRAVVMPRTIPAPTSWQHGDRTLLEVWDCRGERLPVLIGHAQTTEDAWCLAARHGMGRYEVREQGTCILLFDLEVVGQETIAADRGVPMDEALWRTAAPWN